VQTVKLMSGGGRRVADRLQLGQGDVA